jgi:hypothetical protein
MAANEGAGGARWQRSRARRVAAITTRHVDALRHMTRRVNLVG